MLKQSKPQQSKSVTSSPFNKAGLLLIGVLSLGLTVGCGNEKETVNESSANEAAVSESNTVEPVEPDVVIEDEANTEAEQPEAEAVEAETEVNTESSETIVETDSAPLAADAGSKLYESHCKQCHEKGMLSAPKIGDTKAWAPRIEKGIDTLHKHSAEGYKAMPPQAVDGVTVEQVHAAVDYMVDQAK